MAHLNTSDELLTGPFPWGYLPSQGHVGASCNSKGPKMQNFPSDYKCFHVWRLPESETKTMADRVSTLFTGTFVQSRVTLYLGSLRLPTGTKQRALDCLCFGPISGTVLAYPPSPVAMGGSRRPCSNPYYIAVRDGDLHHTQLALRAWANRATVLHSKLSQTMLFLGYLLVGC